MAASKKPVHASPLAMLAVGAAMDLCHQQAGKINTMATMRNFGRGVADAIEGVGLRVDANRLMRGDHGEQAALRAFSRCLSMAASQPAAVRVISMPLFTALGELHAEASREQPALQALALDYSQRLDAAAKRELAPAAKEQVKLFCLHMSSALG